MGGVKVAIDAYKDILRCMGTERVRTILSDSMDRAILRASITQLVRTHYTNVSFPSRYANISEIDLYLPL